MKDQYSVCAIIVSYNRKKDLLRCVNAVLGQSVKVDSVLVVDNASTDGTAVFLCENLGIILNEQKNKVIDCGVLNKVNVYYFRSSENTGGAGGFYIGMKIAHEMTKFDAFWLMDDDGYPSFNCLEKQLDVFGEHDYVMPVSIDVDNHDKLSWPTRLKNGTKTVYYDVLKSEYIDKIYHVFPFNGALFSKKMVDIVGYVNPDLFIWGDDYEHFYRCLKSKFVPVTYLNAVFYHPANKVNLSPIIFGLVKVPYVQSPLRMICLARNWTFINLHYGNSYKIFFRFVAYTWLFLVTQKLNFKDWWLYCLSVKDGFLNDFTRHLKYL